MAQASKFLEHVLEVRARLIKVVFTMMALSALAYPYADEMFRFLAEPAQGKLVFTHPMAGMMAHVKLALMAGFALAAPVAFYQIFQFIKPAFKAETRAAILGFTMTASMLFFFGVAFAWWSMPVVMGYLLAFAGPELQAFLSVDEYFSFVFMLVLGVGLAFEMPLSAYVMGRLGWLSSAFMLRHWRAAILINMFLAAIITPTPDLISMLAVLVPLLGLYLLSWVVVAAVGKNK